MLKILCRHYSTIYALSSGQGKAGVAVIRVSGPKAMESLYSLAGFKKESQIEPRRAYFRNFTNSRTGRSIDKGLVIFFPKPNSFTGEDIIEFHTHGGKAIVKSMFQSLRNLEGYRMAEPGEFMKRSYNNGKIDLISAEAVSDLISAETEAQMALALNQFERTKERNEKFSKWRRVIIECMSTIEAWIDFADSDDIENDVVEQAKAKIRMLMAEIDEMLTDTRRGQRVRDGIKVAIVGPPNAGKSSIMNILYV